jgi:MoaA/NifB/PqqE/SkfB family radical SAM enzyme
VSVKIIRGSDPFAIYGRWNGVAAFTESGQLIGHTAAHDGDFFPESVLDYVEALRQNLRPVQQPFGDLPYPVRVDIDITQICNARCTFCFSRPYQTKGYRGQWTRKELLEQVISDLGRRGTRTIRFCGGGDPLTHPQIEELLPLPHKYGMQLCVITNLDFINEEMSWLLAEHVDHVRWSVNAATDATRISIHRPGRNANPLSRTLTEVRKLLSARPMSGERSRRPMVWATFLVLPGNVDEIVAAAVMLHDAGVDSVSFRPVYHGLGGNWTTKALARIPEILDEVSDLDDRPRFCVFTPKRHLTDANSLNPNDFFDRCISRTVRTVLEATSDGLAQQSCGMYRGGGTSSNLVINDRNDFHSVWGNTQICAHPVQAPSGCAQCIDVSMNTTLHFLEQALKRDPNATFNHVWIESPDVAGHAGVPDGSQ